jgi:hypothetical protein
MRDAEPVPSPDLGSTTPTADTELLEHSEHPLLTRLVGVNEQDEARRSRARWWRDFEVLRWSAEAGSHHGLALLSARSRLAPSALLRGVPRRFFVHAIVRSIASAGCPSTFFLTMLTEEVRFLDNESIQGVYIIALLADSGWRSSMGWHAALCAARRRR